MYYIVCGGLIDISNKKLPWLNIILAFALIAVMVMLSVKYAPEITNIMRNTDTFRDFILSYGNKGTLVFVGFQIIQILIPVIPGEVVQIAGGYVYGTLIGSINVVIGTIIGTVMAFYASRYIGYPIVKIFVRPAKIEKYKAILNTSKVEMIIFIMMLIPGFPKDMLVYMAGLTPIRSIRFIVISVAARLPGQIGCAFIGANIHQKDYTTVLIMLVITAIILGLAYFFRKYKFTKHNI